MQSILVIASKRIDQPDKRLKLLIESVSKGCGWDNCRIHRDELKRGIVLLDIKG